jgi:hypothetical protein
MGNSMEKRKDFAMVVSLMVIYSGKMMVMLKVNLMGVLMEVKSMENYLVTKMDSLREKLRVVLKEMNLESSMVLLMVNKMVIVSVP